MPLFNRSASVVIGKHGEEGLLIKGLRIVFSIEKTSEASADKATIEIYNLNETSRKLISDLDNLCVLSAGYIDGGGEEVIFKGDVLFVDHYFQRPDNVTILELSDGGIALRDTKISKSFSAGTKPEAIISDIAGEMGLPQLDLPDVSTEQYVTGWAFAGQAKDALDQIADRMNLQWSVQDEELQFNEYNKPIDTEAVSLNADSGMIGSPETLKDSDGQTTATRKINGYKITSLLQPKIRPGSPINLESKLVSGFYSANKVTHKGDTHGRDWFSIIEVLEQN